MKGAVLGEISFNDFDESSRKVLREVLSEIKEQWIGNSRQSQFWFYANQFSAPNLSEPVILKWLKILTNRGIIYCYYPKQDFEYLRNVIMGGGKIDPSHDWNSVVTTPLLFANSKETEHAVAVDILGNNIDKLIELTEVTVMWNNFSMDAFGRFLYGGVLLDKINRSEKQKWILESLLHSKEHLLAAGDMEDWFADDPTGNNRSKTISRMNNELRRVSGNDIQIESHRSGNKTDYYELKKRQ